MKQTHRGWFGWTCAIALSALAAYACGSSDDVVTPPAVDGGDVPEAGLLADSDVPDVEIPTAPGDGVDAATRGDATKIVDGSSCLGSDPCDCDNDGYLAMRDGCAGGNDCDDYDGLRHPNQGFVSEPPDPGKDGNWDCSPDGGIDLQYNSGFDCAAILIIGCPSTASGFASKPACGEVADYHGCQVRGLGCASVPLGTRRQGCK